MLAAPGAETCAAKGAEDPVAAERPSETAQVAEEGAGAASEEVADEAGETGWPKAAPSGLRPYGSRRESAGLCTGNHECSARCTRNPPRFKS